ncbi:MAG: DEAD/DEAH box helicase family protein [Fibrobacter sp.]|uniref:DEAD/DEAH box helicase n=1 Tax=Fibrobacter sp. TaxID=35828 RepID=UPI001AFEE1E8|nr:DEAD/DEAH box helicase family protein [Fibrobacter sp.]MBO7062251.1 DEAD/DEAH box helicase family protein [Fibrobacter sp.]MBO7106080.1 DEAD/DEAH box helicase family protein [Fibrobacter sp.]
MILKQYQKDIIEDLTRYLEILQKTRNISESFNEFWRLHPRTPLTPFPGEIVEPYKNNVAGVPHVCLKVPTAGGKTFIAANALRPIFSIFPQDHAKTVVWLVPSNSILEQTIRNFSNPEHPYREQLNADFGNRVEVYDKTALLQGAGFNASSVKENLSLCILSFDSLRSRNKDNRNAYKENGNLLSFAESADEEVSLMSVFKQLNPVIVVDESHNAESELSVDMLKQLNPSFILDLTATPRKNSNIISFTSAFELKKESMVKLPVIVYNHQSKDEVVNSALELRTRLERAAFDAQNQGGAPIRPIVLFQAEPKTKEDNATFDKIKAMLIEKGIKESEIKIKTADKNELAGLDLMSSDCEVRYIITVNALKEGWDCPYAYILASLADKNSAVDVEQILGRVLRLPYTRKNPNPMLNMSYVLTASNKFLDTVQNVVEGLNRAGFSSKDYRIADTQVVNDLPSVAPAAPSPVDLLTPISPEMQEPSGSSFGGIMPTATSWNPGASTSPASPAVQDIERLARQENETMEKQIQESKSTGVAPTPADLEKQVKNAHIKENFIESASGICLPKFFMNMDGIENDLFGLCEMEFEKDMLLKKFPLRTCDTSINFDNVDAEIYKVDLDENTKDNTPTFCKVGKEAQTSLAQWILSIKDVESKRKKCAELLVGLVGKMYPIPDQEIKIYIERVLESFNDTAFNHMLNNSTPYAAKIKAAIQNHADTYVHKEFLSKVDSDKIILKPTYTFKKQKPYSAKGKSIAKGLYEPEESFNNFEAEVVNELANLDNVEFWTRNKERADFGINGFINHYPDFIIKTKKGKIVLLETKGDHLDAAKKIELGNLWASKAGNEYRYCLVYEDRNVEGAYTKEKFLSQMRSW